MSLGMCKLKQQFNTATQQSERPKSNTLTPPHADKGVSNRTQQECGAAGTLIHYWRECKMIETVWKTVGRFLTLTTQSSNLAPWCLSK